MDAVSEVSWRSSQPVQWAILSLAGLALAGLCVWPLPLFGDRMIWTLVLAAAAVLLAHWRVPLTSEYHVRLEVLAVVLAFTAHGPGAGAVTAALSAGYRGWRLEGANEAAREAAVSVLGVLVLFGIYALLVGDLTFGDAIGALVVGSGTLAGARLVISLYLGTLAFKLISEVVIKGATLRSLEWTDELRRWGYAAVALSAVATGLALSHPLLGASAIVMLGPVGALAWAIAVAYRARLTRAYVSIQEKLTSIAVMALSVTLILAAAAISVFFYRDYVEAVTGRYQALAEGLGKGIVQVVGAQGPESAAASVSLQIRELVNEEGGLAYALVMPRNRPQALAFHVAPQWEGFLTRIQDDVGPLTVPGSYRRAWRGDGASLSVENVAVPISSAAGERWGMIHLGVDRTLVVSKFKNMALVVALIFGGALLLSILALWRFGHRGIVRPLQRITDVVRHLSEGDADLRERMDEDRMEHDELGELSRHFNRFMDNLQTIVSISGETSRDVAGSAEELAASAQQLNASAEDVARSMSSVIERLEREEQQLQEIKGLATRLSETAKEVTGLAEDSAESSQEMQSIASESRGKVESATDTLIEVRDVVEGSGRAIAELVEAAKQVSELVQAIAAIADQTDLLALNASIEAARAGSHGRGFAVVAEEIRKLAEQTADASERAGDIIGSVESRVDEVVTTMEAAQEKVSGVEVVSRGARQALADIVEFLEGLSGSVARISGRMQDEARRIEEMQMLVSAVAQFSESNVSSAADVSAATEQQSASTEEIAAGTQQLTRSAERLRSLIERFKI